MSDTNSSYNNDVDLLELVQTIWSGKWIIICFVILAFLFVYAFNVIRPKITFLAITDIKPITSVEHDKYRLFNAHIISLNNLYKNNDKDKDGDKVRNLETMNFEKNNFFQITPKLLLKLFLEQLEEGSIFEEGIRKFQLVNKDNYNNEKEYDDAIVKLASYIQILKPEIENENSRYHKLKFQFNDNIKWKQVMEFAFKEKFNSVKQIINDRFLSSIEIAKQVRKFKIEDINTKIKLAILHYDNITKNKLDYLKEQALIARKLKIKKNTLDTQLLNTQNGVVTNVTTESPFYLRGYQAIEAEINLVENRSRKKSFIPEITTLERELSILENDKTVERAEQLFTKTPLSMDIFNPVLVKVPSTKYTFSDKSTLYYMISILIGGMGGILYVVIGDAFRKRNR